ncbi:MAG TPA: hypothetical protein DCS66_19135 [Flavobacteriaceae bacterium]|nr:hypothetical protein [Flavobacteriaceae bacterium]HAT66674.1 hypothetical protein [Flavobacteriaceae bacterium]|tara:strand:+ start:451 stop:1200 length:750 start_codon:yes stop_codon:yes gene_type:complete
MNKDSKISQELLETVERYLNNTMDATEKLQFEKSLEENNTLRQQVEDIKILLSGIETASLREKMEEFHHQMAQETKEIPVRNITQNNRTNSRLFYAVAASAVILLGIFWVFNPKNSNELLFNEYFSVDPGLPTTMGSTDEFSFYDGMVNYKRKEYDEALEKWRQLLNQKNNNDTLNYFIGVTYLAKGNTEEAIPFLEKVTTQKESMFLEDSYFYLGLSNLKNDNLKDAKENFRKSNTQEAQKILKVLEK